MPAAESSIGDVDARIGLASVLANRFIVGEEKQFASNDRTANAATELVVGQWILGFSRVDEIVLRVELLVADVFVTRAMKIVGSALGFCNHNGATGFAVFGRHAVLLDAEFANRLYRRLHVLATEHRRSDGGAIQKVVIIARPAATDTYVARIPASTDASIPSATPGTTGLLRDPGCQSQEIVGAAATAALGGQLLQFSRAYSLPQISLLGLQDGRVLRRNLYGFAGLSHSQGQIYLRPCIHLYEDVLSKRFLKPLSFGFDFVCAGVQTRGVVQACAVRFPDCGDIRVDIGHSHGGARYDCTAGVGHDSADSPEQTLRRHFLGAHECEQRDHGECGSELA